MRDFFINRCNRIHIGATEFSVTNILLPRYTKSEFPSLSIGATEFGHLTVSHLFGATEFYISVSPRFNSSHL